MTKTLKLDFLYSENQKGGGIFDNLKKAGNDLINSNPVSSTNPDNSVIATSPATFLPSVPIGEAPMADVVDPLPQIGEAPMADVVDPLPQIGEAPMADVIDTSELMGEAPMGDVIDTSELMGEAPMAEAPMADVIDTSELMGEAPMGEVPMVESPMVEAPMADVIDTSELMGEAPMADVIDTSPQMGEAPMADVIDTSAPLMPLSTSIEAPTEMPLDSSMEPPLYSSMEEPVDMPMEEPVDSSIDYNNEFTTEEPTFVDKVKDSMESSLFVDKIKSAFEWIYTTLTSFNMLIIMSIVVLTIIVIYIYNLYKHNLIKIPNSLSDIYTYLFKKKDTPKTTEQRSGGFFDFITKKTSTDDKKINEEPSDALGRHEVFNIDKNIFTYNEAEHVCKKYNSTLATEKQLQDAWEKGANWCNYGWVKGEKALYPIQKEFYDKLKASNSKTKNQCGFVGINGGKLNPRFKLGVNCYGVKPEKNIINDCNNIKVNLDKKLKKIADNLEVNKFNSDKISQFSKN